MPCTRRGARCSIGCSSIARLRPVLTSGTESGSISLLQSGDGRVAGVAIRDKTGEARNIAAGIVIGADGLRSTVARFVGARAYVTGRYSSAVVYGHWEGVQLEGYRWSCKPGISVGAIPTSSNETCIFAAVPSSRFFDAFRGNIAAGHLRLLQEVSPGLAETVVGARRVGNLNGFAGHTGFFRQSWGPGWALVGDAGYFKDPLTAHGITDALRDAELLADAVATGSTAALEHYQQIRDGLAAGVFDVTDRIASFNWDLGSVRTLHEALASEMAHEVRMLATRDELRVLSGSLGVTSPRFVCSSSERSGLYGAHARYSDPRDHCCSGLGAPHAKPHVRTRIRDARGPAPRHADRAGLSSRPIDGQRAIQGPCSAADPPPPRTKHSRRGRAGNGHVSAGRCALERCDADAWKP